MKRRASAIVALAVGLSAMGTLVPPLAHAQAPSPAGETHSVPFGGTQFVLYAPPGHCLLDGRHAADERFAALFFRPRAGKNNTYLGAFLDCKELVSLRSNRPAFGLSFGYYLAVTAGANTPVTQRRDQYLASLCQRFRAHHGSLDLTRADAARHEIETQMQALPVGPPRFGQVVAQDGNGCYQIVLHKRDVLGLQHREVSLTVVTLARDRPVIYTRTVPYLNAASVVDILGKSVPRELAAFLSANP